MKGAKLQRQPLRPRFSAVPEATLKKEPNRLGATIGAARAAGKAGDAAKARQHYAAAVALAACRSDQA